MNEDWKKGLEIAKVIAMAILSILGILGVVKVDNNTQEVKMQTQVIEKQTQVLQALPGFDGRLPPANRPYHEVPGPKK